MMNSKSILYVLVSICLPILAHAKVYVWTKPDGTKVYTDQPPPNEESTKEVEFKSKIFPLPPVTQNEGISDVGKQKVVKKKVYDSCELQSPKNDFFLAAGFQGQLQVAVGIEPGLFNEHKIQLLVDGKVHQEGVGTQFLSKRINRGTHQIGVKIVDSNGVSHCQTQSVAVHVQGFTRK